MLRNFTRIISKNIFCSKFIFRPNLFYATRNCKNKNPKCSKNPNCPSAHKYEYICKKCTYKNCTPSFFCEGCHYLKNPTMLKDFNYYELFGMYFLHYY